MLVKHAKTIARQWIIEEASRIPDFYGAFYHGSINWLSDDAILPATSDVDVMIVLSNPLPPQKVGKFIHQGMMIEASYISSAQLQSPEVILGQSHMAGSFSGPSIILDPTGQLTRLQIAVSKDYAKHQWVRKRCEHAQDKILRNLQGMNASMPFHDQVAPWLFAAGVTTHILLVASLKNPTVRKRYAAVRDLLATYDRLDFYETLLVLLGCGQMSQARVEHHLATLTEAFDIAKTVIKTPFFFAADISDSGRTIAIDGSQEMIRQGYHREAVFWIVATYSRCQKVFYCDASVAIQEKFTPGYRALVADLGITTFADIEQHGTQIKAHLPRIWDVAEIIIAANPEIENASPTRENIGLCN